MQTAHHTSVFTARCYTERGYATCRLSVRP